MMPENTEHHEEEPGVKSESQASGNNGEPGASGADPQAGESKKEGFSDPLEFLNAELERVESEKADLQEQLLRIAADMENLRKRTQKDVADARNYSIAGFAREMLAVADNLGRALSAISPEAREQGEETLRSLIEGVELTEKSMLQALEKGGVKRISPLNEKFDPNFHQAMFEIPNVEVPNNTVLDVVQEGYVIGERVLRPAMVGVSKGGPKGAPKPAAEDEAGADTQAAEPENGEKD